MRDVSSFQCLEITFLAYVLPTIVALSCTSMPCVCLHANVSSAKSLLTPRPPRQFVDFYFPEMLCFPHELDWSLIAVQCKFTTVFFQFTYTYVVAA